MMAADPTDERPHPAAAVDEWLFTAWTHDGSLGVVSGHRLLAGRAWYWSALVRAGRPLLHLAEWDVRVRPDPFVVKAPEMWAEHHCDAPLEQWSIGNEAFFTALDDPSEALGRGYGVPTPTAMDLEWYAIGGPVAMPTGFVQTGFVQDGVVHGSIDVAGEPTTELSEVPARRWRRWSQRPALDPVELPTVVAHTGLRAPFAFPDGAVADWVVSPSGWARRRAR
jgi:hypothetical protein